MILRLLSLPLAFTAFQFFAEKLKALPEWGWPEWKVYLTGELWSALFWTLLLLGSAWLVSKAGRTRRAAWALSLPACAWLLASYFVSYKYLKDMYHLPNVHVMQFTLYEWRNAWALSKDTLHWWHGAAALAAIALCSRWLAGIFLALAPGMGALGNWKRISLFAVLGVSFIACSVVTLGWHRFQDPLPWNANWHRMFYQYALMRSGNTTNLQIAHRPALPDRPRPHNHNVLLIVNESLRADGVFPQAKLLNGFSDTLSPHTLARAQDGLSRIFPVAYSNSGATNVSLPSLAIGLPPEATSYDFHRYPSFWNMAKSLGYRTFLFSSQDWRWEHFDEFFLDRGVDLSVHRRHFPDAPLVNDLGVDDGLVVDSLLRHLASAPRDRPFFGVIQFNVTHPPFYGGPASLQLPFYTPERFRPTAKLLDGYMERLFAGLEKLGLYDSTFILYTSDHGENIRSRNLSRIGAFYDDTHRVPFWIKLPKDAEWLDAHRAWIANLGAWTGRPVQNLDIVPTLAEYWGLAADTSWKIAYAGKSLLGPDYGTPRILSGQNTCEIRAWTPEGCFVFRSPIKLVLANHTPPQLFDQSKDPLEEHNLWDTDSVREANQGWLRDYMRASPGRLDLCRRLGKNCPASFLE